MELIMELDESTDAVADSIDAEITDYFDRKVALHQEPLDNGREQTPKIIPGFRNLYRFFWLA
jgi:hypothetical protein